MDNNTWAVLAPLIYSDLFSFPLTLHEVWQYAGSGGKALREASCHQILQTLAPLVAEQKGYYFLRGRERIVKLRTTGQAHARKKLRIAKHVAAILSRIPTIQCLGVSGSLASGSTEESADIDLFIITKKNRLFLTRFLVLISLAVLGRRRGTDRVCVNMLMDEAALALPPDRHDLYTAWEIARLLPLYERDRSYHAFFSQNRWVNTYLPHVRAKQCQSDRKTPSWLFRFILFLFSIPLVETMFREIQLSWVRRHQSTASITPALAAFHPHDYRRETLRRFERKARQYRQSLAKKSVKTRPEFLDKGTNIFYTA